ncbi:hypothetical protein DM785_02380 [Deinococcus actinosclerus]|nr:hypothetical protein DM785_02380 [Deinococcus actinosclerus]
MSGFSYLSVAPLRLAKFAPRHHQAIAANRERAYRELTRARQAMSHALNDDTASLVRLARLRAAVDDASILHRAWVEADRIAVLAGAWG